MLSVLLCICDTMKKLIILILLTIPGLASAFRPGEPTDFSKKLSKAAIKRTQHKYRSPKSTQHTNLVQKKRYLVTNN
jgi:hypothetical protein